MAVHTGSSKQGQWGQQGQTPISHTRTRDIIRWENHLSPAFPQDYVRPKLLKKKRTTGRITESTVLIRLKRFTQLILPL